MIILSILLPNNVINYRQKTARLAKATLASKNNFANFVKKTGFDDKLKNLNDKVTSNKTKYVLVESELNELLEKIKLLSTKEYSFFLG